MQSSCHRPSHWAPPLNMNACAGRLEARRTGWLPLITSDGWICWIHVPEIKANLGTEVPPLRFVQLEGVPEEQECLCCEQGTAPLR